MPKKRKLAPERSPSKLQLSRWQRQKKLQRIIIISGIFIIASVLGIISFGYYDYKIKPSLEEKQELSQAAFRVNDKVFTNDILLKMLIFTGLGQPSLPSIDFLDSVAEYLQNAEIITQESQKLKISVSDEGIKSEIKKNYPGKEEDFAKRYQSYLDQIGLTDGEYRELIKAELLQKKIREEYITPKVPGEEMQVQVERILLRTEEEANKVIQQLKSGATFPTLVKELSQDPISKEKDGNAGWIMKNEISQAFDEIAFKLKKDEISQPFIDDTVFVKGGYWIIKVTDKQEEKVKAQGILLRTEEEAREVKARLEKGEDFTSLAKELSLDLFARETGGDLGEITKGSFSTEFDEIVFRLEPNQLGGPIFDANRTINGGYWVLRAVEEPQMRILEKEKLEIRQLDAYKKWVDEKKQDYRLENYLDQDKKTKLVIKASNTITLKKAKAKTG